MESCICSVIRSGKTLSASEMYFEKDCEELKPNPIMSAREHDLFIKCCLNDYENLVNIIIFNVYTVEIHFA